MMVHLQEKGIAENTLILFLGDNGSDAPLGNKKGYTSSAPLREKKGSEYEGGMRVPFIACRTQPDERNKWQASHTNRRDTTTDGYRHGPLSHTRESGRSQAA